VFTQLPIFNNLRSNFRVAINTFLSVSYISEKKREKKKGK